MDSTPGRKSKTDSRLCFFALVCGNGVSVAAADPTGTTGILPEDAEVEKTTVPEESGAETAEALEEDGPDREGGASMGEGNEPRQS